MACERRRHYLAAFGVKLKNNTLCGILLALQICILMSVVTIVLETAV